MKSKQPIYKWYCLLLKILLFCHLKFLVTMKKIIYTLTLLFVANFAFAQKYIPCSTDLEFDALKKEHPEVEKQMMQFNQAFLEYVKTVDLSKFKPNAVNPADKKIEAKTGTSRYIIPVVFHILHNNNNFGENVTDAQAVQEIANMNANYNALNLYRSRIRAIFKDVEGNAQITFRLAKKDPQGNPTNGIDRVYVGPMTGKAGDLLKGNTSWDPSRYLNVWVCSSISSNGGSFQAGGYCNYPTSISSYKYDGPIVSSGNGFGVDPVNASGNPFSLITVSHEVGHYLGLLHPFNGSSSTDSCGEDYCYDTPPVYYTPYGTPNNSHSGTCGIDVYSASTTCMTPYLPDQAENFMDYYIGPCASLMFTLQQVARMHFTLENYRRSLWQPENLIATGVNDTINAPLTVPIAAFSITPNNNLTDVRACVGQSITFKDNSFNGTITKWQWDFGDGFTSTLQNPSAVTYTIPGKKTVSLTVTGANGSNTKTVIDYIYIEGPSDVQPNVKVHTADWDWANTYKEEGWHFENEMPYNPWVRTTSAFYDGCASLEFLSAMGGNGYNYSLISPPYNFVGSTNPYLEFYYSFATNFDANNGNKSSQDALSVQVSTDCGKTWTNKKLIGGRSYYSNAIPLQNGTVVDPNPLCTNTGVTSVLPSLDFRPTSQAQWAKVSLSGSTIPAQANVKFKIMLSYGGGNNFYIDNLRIGLSTGINEVTASAMHIGVYPNPFSENTTLTFTMPSKAKVDIKIYDIIGKEIGTVYSGVQELGTQQIVIEKSKFNLNTGLYFIKMTLDGTKEFTHKIVVN